MRNSSGEGKRGPEGGQLQLPPGFRFYPSDEELVVHYLCKRAASQPFPVPIIAEIDLYKFDPWDLPEKALFGEKEWYFFSPRDRKYPNGSRPNRAAGSGYWKATGTDKPIGGGGQKVGVKKALVFYKGRPPKGDKTNWIMHEYRLADSAAKAARRKGSVRLDDWVLCRIYKKLPSATRLALQKEEGTSEEVTGGFEEGLPLEMEEDSKQLANNNIICRLSSGSTTSMMGMQSPSYVHYTNHISNNIYNQPQQTHMGSHLQMASSAKPFIKPPHTNYESIYKPVMPSSSIMHKPNESFMGNQLNATSFSASRPLLTMPILMSGNNDSPVNSSVDEEENSQVIPSANLLNVTASSAEPTPVFNFDGLPSPFGRLESFQQFPF